MQWLKGAVRSRYFGSLFVASGLALATWATYAGGGTKSVYPHLFYVPIIAAAYFHGIGWGFATGLVAGFLAGPIMPLDVETGVAQAPTNWLVRMAFFVGIGLFSGILAYQLRRRVADLVRWHTRAEQLNQQLQAELAQRIEAEQARRKSEELLHLLVDNAQDYAIFMLDRDGRIASWNAGAERLKGYTAADVLGQYFAIFYSQEDRESGRPEINLREAAATGQCEDEGWRARKDGSQFWANAVITALYDEKGELRGFARVTRDITEHRQAEEAVRRQSERAQVLARVAARLNAHLDLDSALDTICEEAAQALNAPTSAVTLYDEHKDALRMAASYGLPADFSRLIDPTLRAVYDQLVQQMGRLLVFPDLQAVPDLPSAELFARFDIRTTAATSMVRDGQLIGLLSIHTLETCRTFTEGELALLEGLGTQAAQAITNAKLFADANRRLQHLTALRNIDEAITGSLDLRVTLNVVLAQVTTQLGVDGAAVLLLNPHTQTLEYAAGHGFWRDEITRSRVRLGVGYAGRAALERRILCVSDLTTAGDSALQKLLTEERFVAYYGVPLVAKGQVEGVLEIFQRKPLDASPEWLNFLEALAGQAAIAIENARLFADFQRSNAELILAYDTTLEGWSRALDLRDHDTEGHTQRVTEMTLSLARQLGIDESELVHIRRGALLHDIGKMGVPDHILRKPGPLTEEEWGIMQQHPVHAYQLLSPIKFLRPTLDIPYCHHEKWDGTGYPRGLRGEQIPLSARIFAVADVWDALSSDRPYRAAWPREKVIRYIQREAGRHFEPRIVQAFLKMQGLAD